MQIYILYHTNLLFTNLNLQRLPYLCSGSLAVAYSYSTTISSAVSIQNSEVPSTGQNCFISIQGLFAPSCSTPQFTLLITLYLLIYHVAIPLLLYLYFNLGLVHLYIYIYIHDLSPFCTTCFLDHLFIISFNIHALLIYHFILALFFLYNFINSPICSPCPQNVMWFLSHFGLLQLYIQFFTLNNKLA